MTLSKKEDRERALVISGLVCFLLLILMCWCWGEHLPMFLKNLVTVVFLISLVWLLGLIDLNNEKSDPNRVCHGPTIPCKTKFCSGLAYPLVDTRDQYLCPICRSKFNDAFHGF